jgi:hypothetical protein
VTNLKSAALVGLSFHATTASAAATVTVGATPRVTL